MQVFAGHTDAVRNVAWHPAPVLFPSSIAREDCGAPLSDFASSLPPLHMCVLASSSRDKNIKIWHVGSSKAISTLTPATKPGGHSDDFGAGANARDWISICWLASDPGPNKTPSLARLVFAAADGRMYSVKFVQPNSAGASDDRSELQLPSTDECSAETVPVRVDEATKAAAPADNGRGRGRMRGRGARSSGKETVTLPFADHAAPVAFDTLHRRPVFSLLCSQACPTQVLSMGMDRKLALWDGHKGKSIFSLSALGGSVFAIDTPLWDPSLVARALL